MSKKKIFKEFVVKGEKISKWVTKTEETEYDSNGNMIHSKDSAGDEEWKEYNSNGKQIHVKNSKGLEVWYEYDSNGNKIYYKDSDGKENYYENQYNSDGKLIKITKYSPM